MRLSPPALAPRQSRQASEPSIPDSRGPQVADRGQAVIQITRIDRAFFVTDGPVQQRQSRLGLGLVQRVKKLAIPVPNTVVEPVLPKVPRIALRGRATLFLKTDIPNSRFEPKSRP